MRDLHPVVGVIVKIFAAISGKDRYTSNVNRTTPGRMFYGGVKISYSLEYWAFPSCKRV